MKPEEQEVERVLDEVRARVRGSTELPGAELTPLQKAVAGVNANWHLSGRLAPPAPGSRRAALLHPVRRAVRRAMLELLSSLIGQENAFHLQVARAVTELAKENAELRRRVAELEASLREPRGPQP